jgi:sterol desaturase/sphingolipid hydroxylase (fatty acid hydroxylase superfamily)
MNELLLGTFVTLGVFALAYSPLERVFPVRAQPLLRRAWRTDLAFFLGQQLLFAGGTIAVLARTEEHLRAVLPASWLTVVAEQGWWLRACEVVVLGDLCVYWVHRAFHQSDLLWRFHRVHHTSQELDWLAAYREHPVDGLCTALAQNLPGFLLGFPLATLAPLIVFRGLCSLLIHSNARLPVGPLRWVIGARELHHWHHARVECTRHNFANLAPWTDLLFGTHFSPPADDFPLGVTERVRLDYVGQLISPFRPAETGAESGTAKLAR